MDSVFPGWSDREDTWGQYARRLRDYWHTCGILADDIVTDDPYVNMNSSLGEGLALTTDFTKQVQASMARLSEYEYIRDDPFSQEVGAWDVVRALRENPKLTAGLVPVPAHAVHFRLVSSAEVCNPGYTGVVIHVMLPLLEEGTSAVRPTPGSDGDEAKCHAAAAESEVGDTVADHHDGEGVGVDGGATAAACLGEDEPTAVWLATLPECEYDDTFPVQLPGHSLDSVKDLGDYQDGYNFLCLRMTAADTHLSEDQAVVLVVCEGNDRFCRVAWSDWKAAFFRLFPPRDAH